jgi:hypothetical protein
VFTPKIGVPFTWPPPQGSVEEHTAAISSEKRPRTKTLIGAGVVPVRRKVLQPRFSECAARSRFQIFLESICPVFIGERHITLNAPGPKLGAVRHSP